MFAKLLTLPKAKEHIKGMYMAPSMEETLKVYDHFVRTFKEEYPKVIQCLEDDFPRVHWVHIGLPILLNRPLQQSD